jgi:hypothetical protein
MWWHIWNRSWATRRRLLRSAWASEGESPGFLLRPGLRRRSVKCGHKSFGHIFCAFWTHIPRVSATYSELFGHISACFGHIFRAFRTHIGVFRPHIPCFSATYSSACRRWLENRHFQDCC